MSPAVVHGSGGPTPTALLFAKRLCGWSRPSPLESVKGKSANIPIPGSGDTPGNLATNLETAARTPDSGVTPRRGWRFALPKENPGQHSFGACPYQEPQQ
eukprot:gene9377-1686_t